MALITIVDKIYKPEGEDKEIEYSRVVVTSESNPKLQAEFRLPQNELNFVRAILEVDGEL